jgi:hypothetical protein
MSKKMKIKYHKDPVLVINRSAFKDDKLVYVACANKKIKYPWGRS